MPLLCEVYIYMYIYKDKGTRSEEEKNLVFVVNLDKHVKHGEEAPLGGGLTLTCR
jgi:hypothetical protein